MQPSEELSSWSRKTAFVKPGVDVIGSIFAHFIEFVQKVGCFELIQLQSIMIFFQGGTDILRK
jgi:hypothetical protein